MQAGKRAAKSVIPYCIETPYWRDNALVPFWASRNSVRNIIVTLALAVIANWPLPANPSSAESVQSSDIGLESGFQDLFFGNHKRGRANVAADFDLDGRVDFFIGNPGDQSFVIRNVASPDGSPRFELGQVLLSGERAWGAAAADYDNDGDYDIYISVGANEGIGFDFLFKNLWIENGGTRLEFVDVTDDAGIKGPVPPGSSEPIPTASANGVWGDYDRDGNVDLFVNTSIHSRSLSALRGRNTLWRNNGDGTFSDVTGAVNLGETSRNTRNSTFLDIDNDGDLDLYESNMGNPNVLWRNRLVETGTAEFEDVTALFSPPGENLSYPLKTFASTTADFNNDGWQDLIAFARGVEDRRHHLSVLVRGTGDRWQHFLAFVRGTDTEAGSPYPLGHAIFINQAGRGFVNVAGAAKLNNPYIGADGVMGSQVGDINGDGVPDVYLGNGSPPNGNANLLFLSDSAVDANPHYVNRTDLVDFPAPENPESQYPPYPYRTHGISLVDVDDDGILEIAVANGGPARSPSRVREPNRLFKFNWAPAFNFFKVHAVGDRKSVV